MDLREIVEIHKHFYTAAGKKLGVALVRAGFINPAHLASKIDQELKEPRSESETLSKEAREIAVSIGLGFIPKDKLQTIVEIAGTESKPFLLRKDYDTIWKAYEADKQYRLRVAGLI